MQSAVHHTQTEMPRDVTPAGAPDEGPAEGMSRRDFLKRAMAAACVLAVPAALTACGSSSSSGGSGSDTSSGPSSASSTSSGSASSGTSTASKISIDSGSCEGCGHCVTACRSGVIGFDPSNRKAYVANADSCTMCGECLKRCRPGAITLGG